MSCHGSRKGKKLLSYFISAVGASCVAVGGLTLYERACAFFGRPSDGTVVCYLNLFSHIVATFCRFSRTYHGRADTANFLLLPSLPPFHSHLQRKHEEKHARASPSIAETDAIHPSSFPPSPGSPPRSGGFQQRAKLHRSLSSERLRSSVLSFYKGTLAVGKFRTSCLS